MSDPPRLSVTQPGGLTASMLDSARDDEPPPSARQRALVAFGAGAGAMLTAGLAEGGAVLSGGAAGTAASGASVATAAKLATWIAVAKWAGGGAVVAMCAAAAVVHVAPSPSADPPQASRLLTSPPSARIERPAVVSPVSVSSPPPGSTEPAAAPAAVAPVPSPAPAAPAPDMVSDTPSRVQSPSPSRAAHATSPNTGTDTTIEPAVQEPAARAPDESLAGEVGWLDRASASIRSGDVERGLQMLDEYKGRFPSGVLTPESQVLRVEALARKGDRANATRLGEAFLARTPQSALAARVRSLLLSMQKEQPPVIAEPNPGHLSQ